MPKVTLSFKLPEERDEFEWANKGADYMLILQELDEYLRQIIKYDRVTESETTVFQAVRDKLRELIEERGAIL